MSVVTNVILSLGPLGLNEEKEFLAEVNKFFGGTKGLVSVDDDSLPRGWYGGNKMLETSIAIGAFNYLDLDALVQHLQSLFMICQFLSDVQLMIKEQNEDHFRIINIFES